MGLGPTPSYLAKYNSYTLPGYVQQESFDSSMRIGDHYAPYADGSNSEILGLQNKMLSLTLKVWEQDYATCKEQVQQAATMLRSKRQGFAPLYVQYSDKHYEALVSSVKVDKTAGDTPRMLEYQVDFQCKPWLISDSTNTLTGSSLARVSTNLVTTGRTITDGGWTPTTITVTGSDITISGYTLAGDFAGFISVSGSVTNLVIDSEGFSSTEGTTNRNAYMRYADYRVWVGPEETTFVVSGATDITIDYHDRWYI
jgi:hypothetical protein